MKRTVDLADKEFAKTYATWDHKPKFEKRTYESSGYISGEVYTLDEIYGYVSRGTKGPYPIPKSGKRLLVFPSGYKAKTKPGSTYSAQGGSFGPLVFVQSVMHPGIKDPRKFDETVAKYVNPWFTKWMEDALKVGARESGHGM